MNSIFDEYKKYFNAWDWCLTWTFHIVTQWRDVVVQPKPSNSPHEYSQTTNTTHFYPNKMYKKKKFWTNNYFQQNSNFEKWQFWYIEVHTFVANSQLNRLNFFMELSMIFWLNKLKFLNIVMDTKINIFSRMHSNSCHRDVIHCNNRIMKWIWCV